MEAPAENFSNLERPKGATSAILFLSASLTIGLIRAIFGLTQRASGTALVLAALIVISFFALGFFLVWKISLGRNWARLVLLVLVVINFPFAVLGNIAELKKSFSSGTPSVAIEVILWIGTCLLFTRNSNLWFKGRK
jgi:hypothetical protein